MFLKHFQDDNKNDFLSSLAKTLTESFDNFKKFMGVINIQHQKEYQERSQLIGLKPKEQNLMEEPDKPKGMDETDLQVGQ
jgi:hypothetical protein